jgi:hypothetical protein
VYWLNCERLGKLSKVSELRKMQARVATGTGFAQEFGSSLGMDRTKVIALNPEVVELLKRELSPLKFTGSPCSLLSSSG